MQLVEDRDSSAGKVYCAVTVEDLTEELIRRLGAARLLTPADLEGYLNIRQNRHLVARGWRGLLRGHVGQAQQILRRLIKGRLTISPQEGGYYAFAGTGTARPLLGGAIRNVASPTGTAASWISVDGATDYLRAAWRRQES